MLPLLSHFSHVWLCATPSTAATRLPRPWDSPGKNTGVGCHFLLQRMKVKSEREVAQSCPTLCKAVDCSPSGSSLHGILQARILEWGAIAFSRGSSWPSDWTRVSHISGRCFNLWARREAHEGIYIKMVNIDDYWIFTVVQDCTKWFFYFGLAHLLIIKHLWSKD